MTQRKSYGVYRESGIKWLGRIPENWSIYRVKSTIEFSQNGVWGEDPDGGSDDIECARVADFDRVSFTVSDNLTTYRKVPEAQRRSREVKDGDLLFEKSGGGEKTLVGAIVQYKGSKAIICSNFVSVIKVKSGVNSRWLCYANAFLYSIGVNSRSIKQATGIQNIDSEQYFSERIPVPSKLEQDRIAIWLDRETARIDTLIAKKTRFIELLKEKRQAVITKAVTKGLDDSVEMKDSRIPWMGAIPAHWRAVPSNWLFLEIKDRSQPDDQHLSASQKHGVIPLSEFERLEGRRVTHAEKNLDQRKHVEVGDFVISMRSFQGGIEIVKARGCVRSSYVALRAGASVDSRFFSYLFKSSAYIQGLQSTATFIRDGQDLSYANFRQVKLPLLCMDEQVRIASYLNRVVSRIDVLVSKTERSIELLKEHRSALITAAVTGKIDVREAA